MDPGTVRLVVLGGCLLFYVVFCIPPVLEFLCPGCCFDNAESADMVELALRRANVVEENTQPEGNCGPRVNASAHYKADEPNGVRISEAEPTTHPWTTTVPSSTLADSSRPRTSPFPAIAGSPTESIALATRGCAAGDTAEANASPKATRNSTVGRVRRGC